MSEPRVLDAALLRSFPLPALDEQADKEERGRLLAIAGCREVPGAALLAGTAGLRAGAGKLQLVTAASVAVALGVALPEARVIGQPETGDGCLCGDEALLACVREAGAVLVGCGLQHGPGLDALLVDLLDCAAKVPLVLDAAVLGSLAAVADKLRAWPGGAALLPHPREMARLLDCALEEVLADPLAAARRAAGHYRAVALIKGAPSFVVAPDGRAFCYEGGGIGLATSGSGDVLAGLVAGLSARGADPLTGTLWGVWLHGEAGRRLGRDVGRVGFLAREIADLVPALLDEGGR